MGWDFFDNITKKNLINILTKDVVRKACYGNELWVLHETQEHKEKLIILYLLKRDKDGYGYKEMSEQEHPYYYKCPLSFLKEAPVKNQNWRDAVMKYHSDKALKSAKR